MTRMELEHPDAAYGITQTVQVEYNGKGDVIRIAGDNFEYYTQDDAKEGYVFQGYELEGWRDPSPPYVK